MTMMARVENDAVLEYKDLQPSDIPPHKAEYWRPVEDIDPPYDPKTQVKEGPSVVVLPDKVTCTWTVRDKTDEEKRAEVDSAVDHIDETQYLGLADLHVRVSKLEGAPTVAPFKDYLKELMKKKRV